MTPEHMENMTLERSLHQANSAISSDILTSSDDMNVTLPAYLDDVFTDTSFFENYYAPERFVAECILAVLSVVCNAIALGISRGHYYQHHAYHSFFKNMALANTLASFSSWLCNNSIFLFSHQLSEMSDFCNVLVILLTLNVWSTAFGLVSGMTIVGFGVIHYLAICWPLRYDSMLTPRRVKLTLMCIWIVSSLVAVWPLLVQSIHSHISQSCSMDYVTWVTIAGADTSMSLLCICYVTLAILCIKIYCEIRKLQERLASTFCEVDDLQFERKAWRTIVMLLSTMTIFFLPYCIVYVISLNFHNSHLNDDKAVLYYMNLLPYLKYATDPVIYGKRMLGLQEALQKKVNDACCARWREYTRSSSSAREDCTRKGQLYHMATLV